MISIIQKNRKILFGLPIASIFCSVLITSAAHAFSEPVNTNIARTMLSAGCSTVNDLTARKTETAIQMLKPIPDSATPAQMGITYQGLDLNKPFLDQVKSDFVDIISKTGVPQCAAQEKLLRYGMSLNENTTPDNIATYETQINTQINPLKDGWITDICSQITDVTCRDRYTELIKQAVTACAAVSAKNNTTPRITSYNDLQKCAGTSVTLDQVKQKECTDSGGAWKDGKCTPKTSAEKETCNVSGIGWIICPLATFVGKTVDAVYTLIEQFMVYDVPDPFGNNPLKVIWSNILGIANVAFIIAFFVVILSQATSIGISNYGIKKMLPRMVAAAILVNLSYYICIFAVDISNAIGAGIDGILMSALPDAKAVTSQVHWETVIVGALGIGAAIAFGPAIVAAAFTFAVPALLAVITTLVVLVARYALITILIVISPLAFVAFVLPNTEDLFNKWRKTFITMLMFYPLVTLLFVGSKVAAYIILLQ